MRAIDILFSENFLVITLTDGFLLSVPISWFPWLENATQQQRNNWELLQEGSWICWPEINRDICMSALACGENN
jgi:hypothetical protein